MTATLETGRKAIESHDWDQALRSLVQADQEQGLSPDDLMLLGDAYWWSAQPDDAVSAFERAFSGYLDQDRPGDAAAVGALLAYLAMRRMAISVVYGWIARVEKLLEGLPESEAHAWYKLLRVGEAMFVNNDLDAAIRLAEETIEISSRLGAPTFHAVALSFKGAAMVLKGQWREGVALVDEATAMAISAGGDLRAASDVYCTTIGVCSSLADYRRAGEWTEQAERWMRANSVGGFTGVCQVHRAELKRLRGLWNEAEQEARRACIELERFHLLNGLGFAHYEIGEVRRRMGDLDAAEEAFMRAYEYGHPAQPGLALLILDRGDTEEAVKSIAGAVAATAGAGSEDILTKGHLLPAQIEILVAAGDLNAAREALAALGEIAEMYDSPTWEAMELTCRGSVELTEGHPDQAAEFLERAWRIWQQIELPYETARAREMLGRARKDKGEDGGARLEFRAARSIYQHLGAITDLRRLEEVVGPPDRGRELGADRLSKAFMFTDIVTSTDLIGIIGDASWERLLEWHDRALRDTFARHGGEEVRHTGDGFFVAFDRARDAIDCAVQIQRTLVEHRREHGFAPVVRIGLHHSEATRKGGDYSGQGVHAAARIGDLAEGEEVVVSSSLVEAAGTIPYPTERARTVPLKGLSDEVEVHTLVWR
jgi:class 3 adenylate cyclase